MKRHLILLTVVLMMLGCTSLAQAQQAQSLTNLPYFTYGKGLGITAPDSLFSINIRFRMQNRMAFTTVDTDDLQIETVEARVRRTRLRFDGFVYSPKLTYTLQLSFTRGDMDYESLNFPNIVRDAWIQYALTKNLSIGIGQTKLPGNRQRVNSSGDLQFVDRSIVNATFNIDRDFGIQFNYRKDFYTVRGAMSSGEGRNISSSDQGMAYTGRVELLPFGHFTNGGDYFEGDLAREKKPKVSLGMAYSHNENAIRTGGQLGTFLYQGTNINTQIIDFLYKHNGWAFASEYIKRTSPNPITTNETGAQRYVFVGHGENYQGSYLFKNNFEIAGRISKITPGHEVEGLEEKVEQYTLGVTKYLKGHRVKIQNDITWEQIQLKGSPTVDGAWIYRFQVELGI